MANYVRTFGEIPGQVEGTSFYSREQVRKAKLHAHNQAGISGTGKQGADAIVLNGGYPDDRDYGEIIVYTGHGGQDSRTKLQIADQTLDDSGNAGLVKSQLDGLPVRVIRGFEEDSPHAPDEGYRYDGLYRVVRHWFKTRDDGFQVCQFLMVKIGSPSDVVDPELPTEIPPGTTLEPLKPVGPAGRSKTTINKVNRRAEVVQRVKAWHGNRCQVCGETVALPSGPSSEAAHIKALGVPHNGPDVEENVLCLCPNDHKRFDNGALYLTDDLEIVDALTSAVGKQLHTHPSHNIGIEYVRYHRACWVKET
ncbi:YDG/SRA domain-containing protein [Actinomadura sp. NPDC048021]|uniref:YDG/SRA domain-containing protein n=1 Tax=Actinomadura sp. NPDC048021 TaxID=3155385 RepID=UPI0033EA2A2F